MVIFGASGDLAQRKLLPALYNLVQKGLLPDDFTIVGYSRTSYTDDEFRDMARAGFERHADVEFQESAWQTFAQGLFVVGLPHSGCQIPMMWPSGAASEAKLP